MNPALSPDLHHFLHSELFSAGAQQTHSGPFSRDRGQHHRGAARHRDAVLLLLIYPNLHGLYKRRIAPGCDLLVSDFFAHGRSRESRPVDEHFRR